MINFFSRQEQPGYDLLGLKFDSVVGLTSEEITALEPGNVLLSNELRTYKLSLNGVKLFNRVQPNGTEAYRNRFYSNVFESNTAPTLRQQLLITIMDPAERLKFDLNRYFLPQLQQLIFQKQTDNENTRLQELFLRQFTQLVARHEKFLISNNTAEKSNNSTQRDNTKLLLTALSNVTERIFDNINNKEINPKQKLNSSSQDADLSREPEFGFELEFEKETTPNQKLNSSSEDADLSKESKFEKGSGSESELALELEFDDVMNAMNAIDEPSINLNHSNICVINLYMVYSVLIDNLINIASFDFEQAEQKLQASLEQAKQNLQQHIGFDEKSTLLDDAQFSLIQSLYSEFLENAQDETGNWRRMNSSVRDFKSYHQVKAKEFQVGSTEESKSKKRSLSRSRHDN